MVTRYDVISSRWSSLFWVKIDVFQLFSTIKVKLVYEMIQSPSLCFILHGKHKSKLPFIAILTWFPILDKMQVGGKDSDHCWWPHRPPAAPPPTEGKIVSKYCKISKTLGRGSINPPPPPLCTIVGVWIYAYVRGLVLGCKLRNGDCSANVFSSKPWIVLRNMLRNILSLSHIKSKSNYILESLLFVSYGFA